MEKKNLRNMNKVAVIGAVSTTRVTLEKLVEHGFEIVAVLGHEPTNPNLVSGLEDLRALSKSLNIPFRGYTKINEDCLIDWVSGKQPDLLFAVGFSQLLSQQWLDLPKIATVGFHPTKLPKGRGRAPLAWLVLEEKQGAANFFVMNENADDGPILASSSFDINKEDDAKEVENKIIHATKKALDNWLPELKQGYWNPIEQDFSKATWYGKRSPVDGLIDWTNTAEKIDRLVKASTDPHPGAYTFFNDNKLRIWKGCPDYEIPIKGVPGRVLLKENNMLLIQTGTSPFWIKEFSLESEKKPNVGSLLGYSVQEEIYKIYKLLNKLQNED